MSSLKSPSVIVLTILALLLMCCPVVTAATFDGYTQSVLYFNTTVNSTAPFNDDATGSLNVWTPQGAAKLQTEIAFPNFHGALQNNINGSTAIESYVTPSNNTFADFGSGDWTFEGKMYPVSIGNGYYSTLFCNAAASRFIALYDTSGVGTTPVLRLYTGSASISSTTSLTFNRWWNFSVVHTGTNSSLYLEGIYNGSSSTDSATYDFGATRIGGDPTDTRWGFRGYLDNLRFSNTARYTTNYVVSNEEWTSPPVPVDTNSTVSLLPYPAVGSVSNKINLTLNVLNTFAYPQAAVVNVTWNTTSLNVTSINLNNTVLSGNTLSSAISYSSGWALVNVSNSSILDTSVTTPLADIEFDILDNTNVTEPINYLSALYINNSATTSFPVADPGLIEISSLKANFTAVPTGGIPPLNVTFTDTSEGSPISWEWDFGDGSTYTGASPPEHTYSLNGSYIVNLTVSDIMASTSTKLSTINVFGDLNSNSALSFKSDRNVLENKSVYNRTIQLNNVTNASYLRGTTLFDPLQVHVTGVFANTTSLPLTLTSYSIDNSTGTVSFNVTKTPCGFGVTLAPVSVVDIQMLYYNYTAQSTTPAAWGTGYLGNCTTYLEYPISIFTDAPLSYSWETFSYFEVNTTTPIISESSVQFTPTDTNQSANRWLWNYGDGSTFLSANRSGESHIYTGVPATYSPSLTAYLIENISVTNTTTRAGLITTVWNESYINADFIASPTTGTPGVAVSFTDLSVYGNTTGLVYNWSFGDAYSSTPYSDIVGDVTHVYPVAGTYTVNLTITNALGSDHEEKLNYIIVSTSQRSQTTFYIPQQIRVIAVNSMGNTIEGVYITATPLNFTAPVGWTDTLLGISPSVGIEGTTCFGYTGSDGSWAAPMLASFRYLFTFTNATESINHTVTFYPQDPSYRVYIPTNIIANNTLTQVTKSSTPFYKLNSTGYYNLSMIYQDPQGYTTHLEFNVRDYTHGNTLVYTKSWDYPGTSIIVDNYTAYVPLGQEYTWQYNSTKI